MARIIIILLLGCLTHVNSNAQGKKWISCKTNSKAMLTSVAYGNNVFVAAGERGVVLTSPNGVQWSAQQTITTNLILSIAFGNGRFVALTSEGSLLASTNGKQWKKTYDNNSLGLRDIVFCNRQFIALGNDGAMLTSTNGTQWKLEQPETFEGASLKGIAHGGNALVVVTNESAIFIKKINSEWKKIETTLSGIVEVVYGNNLFIAVSEDGKVYTSIDGTKWTTKDLLKRYQLTVSNFVFSNNLFIVVGSPGLVITSADGKTWREELPDTSGDLLSATYAKGKLVVTGTMGGIFTK